MEKKKSSHKSTECPLRFDVRTLTIKDLESLLEAKYAQLDKVVENDPLEETEEMEEKLILQDFTQDDE